MPIAALVRRWRPIRAMTAGFFVASCSWLLIAYFHTWQVVVVAMIVLALGEAMQAPRFYEYVAEFAPRDQVGTFMGFAFLPVAIGSVVGGVLAGTLVKRFVGSPNPSAMWWVISIIGFVATLGMVLYDRFVAKEAAAPTP